MASAQLRISRRIGIDVDLCPIPGFEIGTGFLIPLFHYSIYKTEVTGLTAKCPRGYKNTYTFMGKGIPGSGRVFLRASASETPIQHGPQTLASQAQFLCPPRFTCRLHSDIRTALTEGNRFRFGQTDSELLAHLAKGKGAVQEFF
jgi:hypothetical protein